MKPYCASFFGLKPGWSAVLPAASFVSFCAALRNVSDAGSLGFQVRFETSTPAFETRSVF